jgi:lipopolysaccharide export system protein LptA
MAMGGRRGKAGSISVARVRRWLLAGVVALVLLLAGLIGYTRWKTRKLLTDLPHRLGIDIKSVTDGFTWSQSVKGHTIFTIHAAKAIQRENGKTTLHDVAITLYGAPGTNRTDSISGAEFEYDQPNGIVRAAGEVHLDLAAPTPAVNSVNDVKSALQSTVTDTSKPEAPKPVDESKRIRVTTSGLTFLQKQGIAQTDQPLQIVYGDMRGSATGADYESNTGFLKLHSAVEMNGTQNRQNVHLRAAAAEMDRVSQRATLHGAHITTDADGASGDLMIIGLAKTGGIESVHAEGHGRLESKAGMTAQAPKMDAQMSTAGKLHDVLMQGGVQFANATGAKGSSNRATVHFDAQGIATSADFNGGVQLDQSTPTAHRSVTAEHVVTLLAKDATGHTALHEATATGSAIVRTSELVAAKANQPQTTQVTTLRGNTLRALTAQRNGTTYVSEIIGAGSTLLVQDDGAGTVRTSAGDDLHATLAAPPAATLGKSAAPLPKSGPAGQVQTAVQTGHVVVTQRSPAKGAQPAGETRATSARAEFDNATGGLVLTGAPQVTSPVMQLAADRIVLQQGSGDAEATGSVRGVYIAAAAPADKSADKRPTDPVHLLADHAAVSGGGSAAKLFGTPGKLARMWSSTAQIEAPVIETDRATGKLFAHAAGTEAGTVRMLLPLQNAAGKAAPAASGALRILGTTLVYTPADAHGAAHADIGGGVRMDSPGMQLTAKSAIATIAGAAPTTGKTASPLSGGNIQTVTATGDVHLQQPGRSGMGERLVYTAADQRYELTGTAAAPPHVQDSQRGNVTGAVLVFHGADDSVEVSGEAGHRVRTEMEVAKPAKGR